MKKILILISLVVCCLVCSCKKESSIKPYTERQEAAMRILSGTFIYQNSSVDWLKTTYIFGQQYQEPKKVKNEDGETTTLHGEVRHIYYNGDTYDEYYWLSSNANEIFFYRKSHSLLKFCLTLCFICKVFIAEFCRKQLICFRIPGFKVAAV